MTSTATASAPVTPAPRKGDSVLIDGVIPHKAMSEPHTIVVKVYFAEVARTADIAWNKTTSAHLNQLKRDQGVYLASTREDYLALRPHEIY